MTSTSYRHKVSRSTVLSTKASTERDKGASEKVSTDISMEDEPKWQLNDCRILTS